MHHVAVIAVGNRADDLRRHVAQGLTEALGCAAVLLPAHVDVERFYDSGRGQYWSTPMLAELEAVRPPGMDRVLGLTGVDLFVPVLSYVFGEAHLEGTAALVSRHRLDPQVYGLDADEARLTERSIKEAAHELGHTWGLRHCRDFACVMRASRVAEEVDEKAAGFCPACAQHLSERGLQPRLRRP